MDIVLGTVQFGMDYGVTNIDGRIHQNEAKSILREALKNNITELDTAPGYGEAEYILGVLGIQGFKIVTKTPHFLNAELNIEDINFLTSNIKKSKKNMKINQIDTLLVHNIQDVYKKGFEEIYKVLLEMKNQKEIKKIGFSVYTVEDILFLMNKEIEFDAIQLPLNVLDQRMKQAKIFKELKRKNIEIYARSIFLQGKLLEDLTRIDKPTGKYLKLYFDELERNDMSKLEGCLSFVKTISEIDHIVLGVTNVKQLKEIINAWKKISLTNKVINFDKYAVSDVNIIDPRRW